MKPLKIFSVFFIILFLIHCNSSKITFQENPEFVIQNVYAQDYVGGQPGNVGTNVLIYLSLENNTIIPDSLYFQNRVASIDIKPDEKNTLWVAHFKKADRIDPNFDENISGKITTEIPEMKNFPFQLEQDEAILLFHQNNTAFYYKITGIIQKETIFYPSARPD